VPLPHPTRPPVQDDTVFGRQVRAALVAVFLGFLAAAPAFAQSVPLWQRLLRWTGGDSDETTVPTMKMGEHMQMSLHQDTKAGDAERAATIVAAAKRVLDHYRDVATAERDGYRAFAPRGTIGEEVHYTNRWKAGREAKTLDLDQPGSILYRRTADGMVAVGVMYTARADATAEQLDARLPLSVAVWHRHIDFCGWPSGTPRGDWDGPNARFGFAGSIHTREACQQAGGYWIPLAFGWMSHVYPFETDSGRVWAGDHAMTVNDVEKANP
jgi:hypothetical protein